MFGGYSGYLANENQTEIMLPYPYNISANKYCYSGEGAKELIIKRCKHDGEVIFNCNKFNIIDMTRK